MENKNWPDGPQLRKEIQLFEPDGWAHSEWSWRSCRYVDHSGSLYPKVNKAECCHCLGVLECPTCGMIVRPSTKAADMKAQITRNCPNLVACGDKLLWITSKARTYCFVLNEHGSEYSIWEHTGYHSHVRPPAGRQPPHSVPMPHIRHSRASTMQPRTLTMHSQPNQTTRQDTSDLERREHSRSSVTHSKMPTTHL